MSERRVALIAALIGAIGAITAAVITVVLPETCHRSSETGRSNAVASPHSSAPATKPGAAVPGLLGEFWNVPPFDREPQPPAGVPTATRVDTRIDFAWRDDSPAPNVAADYFVARWSGEVHAPVSGTYQFLVNHNDGARLTVNGTAVVDWWRRGGGHARRGDVYLEGDRWYPIELDMFDRDNWAEVQLSWRRPGAGVEVVGAEFLRTAKSR